MKKFFSLVLHLPFEEMFYLVLIELRALCVTLWFKSVSLRAGRPDRGIKAPGRVPAQLFPGRLVGTTVRQGFSF